jgi:serine protease Do
MRIMRVPELVLFLTLIALLIVSFNKATHASISPTKAGTISTASRVVPASVVLPNSTALAKNEGTAVINSSTTKKRGEHSFSSLFGLAPDNQFSHEIRSQSPNSGLIVSADKYIFTNARVVEGTNEVTIRLNDQREFKAKVVGADRRSDFALLKISAKSLPVVSIDESLRPEAGNGSTLSIRHSIPLTRLFKAS